MLIGACNPLVVSKFGLQARQNGTTTPEFDTFVRREADRMRAFYEYWAERRLADAERGIKTLYVRYEVLCERTSSVLDNVIEFIGYRSDKASLVSWLFKLEFDRLWPVYRHHAAPTPCV